ncbi:class I SAM-dependent methyltransferase [Sphingomonas sp.]|jgi:hypothetical protein|uniref:class I SAM-dependent methyltransferase n=1 Tax=Sphingomonas sp. TaxID=28214 RepID=UPI0026181AC5|nr:class I SAM-dependent methyltransferase [Sphingomonas sp.]MDF2495736.1 hypothetical protein [Sphingomonas sp.]
MPNISSFVDGVKRRLQGRTPAEVIALSFKTVRHAGRRLSPGAARARNADQAFDRRWGTDTGGTVNLSALSVSRDRALLGCGYQASNGVALEEALAAAGVNPADYSFIDYGSGKGRVVMIAAALGFRRAIGVEFAPELHDVALQNGDRFAAAGGASTRCEFVLGDAGSYDPPAGPIFAYIYNSFGTVILREVLNRLEERAAQGDPVVAVYVNPRNRDAYEQNGRWDIVADRNDWVLYNPVR